MEHAGIQPSSAGRWVHCPGSITMEMMYPEAGGESDASEDGVLAHAVAAAMLEGKPIPAGATDEMLDGAERYTDDIQGVIRTVGPHIRPSVETRVLIKAIHDECWGTPDCVVVDVAHGAIYVWDYKFGHRYVTPFENWQLLAYAIGKLESYGTATTGELKLHLRIVQPRSYHPDGPVREWVIPASEVWSYRNALRDAAHAAMAPNPPTKTNGECRDCKARHACPALQASAYASVHTAGVAVPFDMPPEAQGRELATLQVAADVLKARISGLENEVLGNIKRGVSISGWMTKQGTGREKWVKPLEEVIALGVMMNVDVSKPAALTPKQAIKAGIPAAVVAAYTETPMGEITLVRDNGAQARKVFQGVQK